MNNEYASKCAVFPSIQCFFTPSYTLHHYTIAFRIFLIFHPIFIFFYAFHGLITSMDINRSQLTVEVLIVNILTSSGWNDLQLKIETDTQQTIEIDSSWALSMLNALTKSWECIDVFHRSSFNSKINAHCKIRHLVPSINFYQWIHQPIYIDRYHHRLLWWY